MLHTATDVTITDSVVSLLMRLHNRLCDKKGSYIPLSMRGEMMDESNLVGGGPFFVGRVMDTLCAKSEVCARTIETIYKELTPKSSMEGTSASAR